MPQNKLKQKVEALTKGCSAVNRRFTNNASLLKAL